MVGKHVYHYPKVLVDIFRCPHIEERCLCSFACSSYILHSYTLWHFLSLRSVIQFDQQNVQPPHHCRPTTSLFPADSLIEHCPPLARDLERTVQTPPPPQCRLTGRISENLLLFVEKKKKRRKS